MNRTQALCRTAAFFACTIALGLVLSRAEAVDEPTNFDAATTSDGNIGLAVSNYGRVGNDFRNRFASFEFPSRSGDEHMTRGGIWIGGVVIDSTGSLDTLVSTSVVDTRVGAAAGSGTEFTPLRQSDWLPGVTILERSRQPNDPFASPDAIADQEFIAIYTDSVPIPDELDPHRPLFVKVRQTTLVWGFEPFDGIVFQLYEITNRSRTRNIRDLYVGVYSELATGSKATASRWPPGSEWFGKKDIGYVDSLRLITEHRCAGIAGDPVFADTWGGIAFLGVTPDSLDDKDVTFQAWHWDPGSVDRSTDRQRYELMIGGTVDGTMGQECNQPPPSGSTDASFDPVTFVGVGPFPTLGLAEADTVRFGIAFVGGLDEADLHKHAREAQGAYDKRFRIPVPPTVPAVLTEPGRNTITLRWDASAESAIDPQSGEADFEGYRIYLSRSGTTETFELIKEADIVDTLSAPPDQTQEDIRFNTGLGSLIADDPVTVVSGADTLVYGYKYVIRNLRDGFKYFSALTAFDRGAVEIGPLESGISQTRTLSIPGTQAVMDFRDDSPNKVRVFPNPYRGDAVWDQPLIRDRYLWFTNLPARCTIRIYTLGGDLVDTIDFDGAEYDARDVRGIYDPTDPNNPDLDLPLLPGGMAAWDLITRKDQAIATGLYLFSVEDEDTGQRQVGQFLVIK